METGVPSSSHAIPLRSILKAVRGEGKAVASQAASASPLPATRQPSSVRPEKPVVPRLSLRRIFREKERCGDYKLKMDYQCDTPPDSDGELEASDPIISEDLLEEAIEELLNRRHPAKPQVKQPKADDMWIFFRGCLQEEEQHELCCGPAERAGWGLGESLSAPALLPSTTKNSLDASFQRVVEFI
ncbi:unnamed protein product [Effrenium voratum]|nr:unnamed protein product [Effrenium voratum]